MRLKDLLITLVIFQIGIFLYYVPNTIRYFSSIFSSMYDIRSIFQYLNQFVGFAVNIAGIVAVVMYFVRNNNIYTRLLKLYLIHHTFSMIAFIPNRIMWTLDPPGGTPIFEWYHHLFFLISLTVSVVAILVYSQQKIRVLPAPVHNRGVRFAHYVIDNIYISLTSMSSVAIFINNRFSYRDADIAYEIISLVVALALPFIYYSICEAGFKQTLGKVITGSYVRSKNGDPAGLGNILGRSLCRYIPFEPFSYLPDPLAQWHDKFSGTDVFYKSNVNFEEVDPILDHLITEEDRASV